MPGKLQDYILETRLLMNDVDMPKSQAQQLSAINNLPSKNKKKGGKRGKKNDILLQHQANSYEYDPTRMENELNVDMMVYSIDNNEKLIDQVIEPSNTAYNPLAPFKEAEVVYQLKADNIAKKAD